MRLSRAVTKHSQSPDDFFGAQEDVLRKRNMPIISFMRTA